MTIFNKYPNLSFASTIEITFFHSPCAELLACEFVWVAQWYLLPLIRSLHCVQYNYKRSTKPAPWYFFSKWLRFIRLFLKQKYWLAHRLQSNTCMPFKFRVHICKLWMLYESWLQAFKVDDAHMAVTVSFVCFKSLVSVIHVQALQSFPKGVGPSNRLVVVVGC